MSSAQQPSNLALPSTSQHLDGIVGTKAPALCSPTEAAQRRPIYIISPDVVDASRISTSKYAQHGPAKADPIFAFSFVDNLTVNDASKHNNDVIRKRAEKILRDIATVGRGRAFEYGLGDRRAVCGLYPRQIFENGTTHLVSNLVAKVGQVGNGWGVE